MIETLYGLLISSALLTVGILWLMLMLVAVSWIVEKIIG